MKKVASLPASILLSLAGSAVAAPTAINASCPRLISSGSTQALDRRVEAGDGRAAYCLAAGLHSLDGGELEDALVALGRYGDKKPIELLLLAHRGILSKASLADAVQMLPGSMTDNRHGQAKAMKIRRDQFAAVVQPTLVALRNLAVQSMDSALVEIMRH